MCGEGMFEWPRTEGPALALELLASERGGRCSSLRSFDAIGGAIARGTAPKRVTGRPAAPDPRALTPRGALPTLRFLAAFLAG